MYKSSSKNFQPGLQPNSEQKADEMHVSPAIANALVVGIIGSGFIFNVFCQLTVSKEITVVWKSAET